MKLDELVLGISTKFDKAINSISSMITKTSQLNDKTKSLENTLNNVNKIIDETASKRLDNTKSLDVSKAIDIDSLKSKIKDLQKEKKTIDYILNAMNTRYKGQAPGEIMVDNVWYNAMPKDIELMKGRLKDIQNEITETTNKIKEMNNTGTPKLVPNTPKVFDKEDVEDGIEGYSRLSKVLNTISKSTSKLVRITSKLGNTFKKTTKTLEKGFDNTFGKIQKMALGLLGVRTVMSVLTKAVGSYLSFDSELQDSINNSWNMLGSLLAPAIELVAQGFSNAANFAYQFIHALTGIDLVARANAKALETQAKKTKEAANAQKGLLGMDEITNLPTESSTSPADQISVDDIKVDGIFSKIIDELKRGQWHLVGEEIAHGINNALKSIDWEKIKNGAGYLGKGIADFLTGLFEVDWREIGRTIAEGINTALEFAYNFVENFSFVEMLGGIGRSLQTAIDTIDWKKMATTISDGMINLLNGIIAFTESLDSNKIAESIQTLVDNIEWGKIANRLILVLGDIAFLVIDTVFKTSGKYVLQLVENIGNTIVMRIYDFIISIAETMAFVLDAIKLPFEIGKNIAIGAFAAILKFVKGDFKGTFNAIFTGIANSFRKVINFIIDGINLFLQPFRTIVANLGRITGKNWTLDNVKIKNVPALATGTNNIESEGLYHLHEGEAVVPKKYNPSTGGYNNEQDNKMIIDLLISLNSTMAQYVDKPTVLNVDGKKIAEATYDSLENIRKNKNSTSFVSRS